MSDVEVMEENRRQILWLLVIGIVSWQGFDLAADSLKLTGGLHALWIAAKTASLTGAITWAVAMIRMSFFRRRMKRRPAVAAALEDEVVQDARLRALVLAFQVTLATLGMLLAVDLLHPLPLQFGVRLTVMIGVSVALVSFLRARKAEENG